MYKENESRRLGFTWDEYQDGKGGFEPLKEALLAGDTAQIKHLNIANWENAFEGGGCEKIVACLCENAEKFPNLESLQVGDMESEECEISWIVQTDYSAVWKALPGLKHLVIQGSDGLKLSAIASDCLESLEIRCGGLPKTVIADIAAAKTPNLKKLNLYIGVEDYGFDGSMEDVRNLLEKADFPHLEYLGVCNSFEGDKVAEIVCGCKFAKQVKTLDLSKSVTTDKGAETLVQGASAFTNLEKLDLAYHFITNAWCEKLKALPFAVDVSDAQEYDDEDEWYNWPMFTE